MKMLLTDVSVTYDSNQTVLELKGLTQDLQQLRELQGQEVEISPAIRTAGLSQTYTSTGVRVNSEGRIEVSYPTNDGEENITYRVNPDGTMTLVSEDKDLADSSIDEPNKEDYAYKKSINACITWLLKHNYKRPIIICRNEKEFLCGEQDAILAMDKDFSEYKGLYGIKTELLFKSSKRYREQKIDRLFESIENY